MLRESAEDPGLGVPKSIEVGLKHLEPLIRDWRGETAKTIQGQNANISIRAKDSDLPQEHETEENPGEIHLVGRVSSEVNRTISKKEFWNNIAQAAWQCADPGLQFQDTINSWNPNDYRKFPETEIRSTNPCAEFIYVDDSACNLASLHLGKYENQEALAKAAYLWTAVLEITVRLASYPSREIAINSQDHRPLGLGIANLGGWLMENGIAYDSEEGRKLAARTMATVHGAAGMMSSEIAEILGPCKAWQKSRNRAIQIWKRHHKAYLDQFQDEEYTSDLWKKLLERIPKTGLRNMQLTAIAPTGTIALLMDCTTTGMEPELSLVKTKTLDGGGEIRIINKLVEPALQATQMESEKIDEILEWLKDSGSLQIDTSKDGISNP